MKRLFTLFAFMLVAGVGSMFAQTPCTPDFTVSEPGLDPDTLPCPVVDVAYDQTIQFKNFDTVTFGGTTVTVTRIRIDSINNIPCGIKWATNKSSRIYDNQENGCIRIIGTSSDNAGDYDLKIWVSADLNGSGSFIGPLAASTIGLRYDISMNALVADPCTQPDTSGPFETASCNYVYAGEWPTGFPTGINDLSEDIQSLSIVPSVVNNSAEVRFTAADYGVYTMNIVDMLGKTVSSKSIAVSGGQNNVTIEKGEMSAGVYLLSIGNGEAAVTERFIVTQ